jgi:thioesterase domain-containing protein/acyl carrier protein
LEALCRLVAEEIGTGRIGVDDNFFEAGANSLTVIKIVGRIRTTFGIRIGPETVFRHPTVSAVAGQLEIDNQGADALDPVLVLRPHGGRPPLFCVHPGGGMSWCYTSLLGSLDPDRPVVGLQARGLRPGETPARGGVTEMTDDYLRLIREVQPRGPYHLLGWSFGGTVAHALACRMQQDGEQVGLLAVMDAEPVATAGPTGPPTARELMLGLLQEFGYDRRDLASMPLRPDRVVTLLRQESSAMAYLEPAHVNAVLEIFANNHRAMHGYRPEVFDGDLEFFSASDESAVDASRWSPYLSGQIRVHPLPCTHRDIARPEHLAEIARILNTVLA